MIGQPAPDDPHRREHESDDADRSGDAARHDQLVGATLARPPRGIAATFLEIRHGAA